MIRTETFFAQNVHIRKLGTGGHALKMLFELADVLLVPLDFVFFFGVRVASVVIRGPDCLQNFLDCCKIHRFLWFENKIILRNQFPENAAITQNQVQSAPLDGPLVIIRKVGVGKSAEEQSNELRKFGHLESKRAIKYRCG